VAQRQEIEFLTEKWQITIPLEGLDFRIKGEFKLQNATVKTRRIKWKKKREEAMVTVDADGDIQSARAKAKALIDRIAARLSYSCGMEIRLKEEVYIKQLEPKTAKKKKEKGWGYHEYRRTVRKTVIIGDRHSSMIGFVRELEGLQQEKQDVISRAVAYYREALAVENPFQRITTFFSCIQVIVRDEVGENDVKPRHIYDVLEDYVKLDPKESRDYYGKFRSAAAHGQQDILDSSNFREAEEIAVKVRRITFRLIREYAMRNKQQHQHQ
jgi:hypothetical protein